MPSSKNYKRDYKQEYRQNQSSPSERRKRSSRNKARRKLMKQGKVRLGDGLDVDHKNTNPLDNSSNNLRAEPKSKNRSFKRNSNAGKRRR
jgi:hypothetical protein